MEKEVILTGEKKVMFSAPHNARQTREGRIKWEEPHTGIICEKLNTLGYPVAIKLDSKGEDAMWDPISPYREKLKQYIRENNIKMLIDLHQMKKSRATDLCLGTHFYQFISKEFTEKIKNYLQKDYKDFLIQIDTPFNAGKKENVSRNIFEEIGITTLQIEINSRNAQEPEFRKNIVKTLDDLIENVIKKEIDL